MTRAPLSTSLLAAICVAMALLAPAVARAQDAGMASDASSLATGDAGGSADSAVPTTGAAVNDAGQGAAIAAPHRAPPAEPAGEQVEVIAPREPLHPERPGVTVWFAPVYLFYFGINSTLSLTLGTNIPIVRYWDIVVEGTLQLGARAADNLRLNGMRLNVPDPMTMPTRPYVDPYFGVRGAVGVSHLFGIRGSLLGPFILPKFTFGYRSINEAHCVPDCATAGWTVMRRTATEGDVGIELDVGFQFQARHFFVALIIGVGVGYCINCIVPENPMMPPPTVVRANQFQPQFNFDALRIGVTF